MATLTPDDLAWGPDGLVPVVSRDVATGEVLMLAYMNREALRQTLQTGRAVYYSRSRRSLWPKGETSGNVQRVHAVRADCDLDALLLDVRQEGSGACHTGSWSCFFQQVSGEPEKPGPGAAGRETGPEQPELAPASQPGSALSPSPSPGPSAPPGSAVLEELARVVRDRRQHPRPGSYTNRLLDAAPDLILKKVMEEAGEVLLAAKAVEFAREAHGTPQAMERARAELAWEAADLLYHLLVTLEWAEVPLDAVWRELARRRGAFAPQLPGEGVR